MSVDGLVRAGERSLAEAGVASPRHDAELLLDHLVGGRSRRFTLTSVAPEVSDRYAELVERRAAREPLQHILGSAWFRRIELAVGPGVFTPRPETELLVEWGLSVLPAGECLVVDLCAGSGAIGLAVADERPLAEVQLVESSVDALPWLSRNAAGYANAFVTPGDALSALGELAGRVDLLLCNPPYVPDGTPLPAEVAHDPAPALWGGPDGLDLIRPLARRAYALLRPGGFAGFEHDESHPAQVRAALADAGLTGATTHDDLAGRPRFSTARKA